MENMPLKEHSPARNSDLLPVARANVEWMGGVLEHYPIESSARELVAITCLYGALRHFNGICVLVEADAFASAFALLRVEWQALLNGAWLFAACPEHLLQDYALGAREFNRSSSIRSGNPECSLIRKSESANSCTTIRTPDTIKSTASSTKVWWRKPVHLASLMVSCSSPFAWP
jgi:hypothetical protein